MEAAFPQQPLVSGNVTSQPGQRSGSQQASLSLTPNGAAESANEEPPRKKVKQTRNKPTLSCQDCVAHKTKCDRGRPECVACIKRGSQCKYSHVANILAASDDGSQHRTRKRKSSSSLEHNSPGLGLGDRLRSKFSIANITNPSPAADSPISYTSFENAGPLSFLSGPQAQTQSASTRHSRSQTASKQNGNEAQSFGPRRTLSGFGGAGLLPSAENTSMSVFGFGGEHPFSNYWTCKGGLTEVVGVLPSKEQADILIVKYFEIVDPVYPILDRPSFLKEYEHFWSLSMDEKCKYDAATVSLYFVMFATATQYIELPSAAERTKTAEFYISAGHQALRISSYLNRMTVTTVQTMVLIFYFLINDNHVSDAWTFSGITQRQAYVLQLNREPDLVVPLASIAEKNMRCKLWSAIIFQESSIALSLRLPSTRPESDAGPHSLNYDEANGVNYDETEERDALGADIDIAVTQNVEDGDPVTGKLRSSLTKTDISYSISIWKYAQFVQQNVCGKRALGLPICQSNEHKGDMLSHFRNLYRSFPQPFGSYDPKRFLDSSRRVARQQIALTQNFFHAMMLICADENQQADVIKDTYGTFEAAHEAIGAFFAMNALFGDETNGWWAYQHKAFEEAMLIANLLAQDIKPFFLPQVNSGLSREYTMLVTAKDDVERLLQIMSTNRGFFEFQSVQERRLDTLQALFDTITVV